MPQTMLPGSELEFENREVAPASERGFEEHPAVALTVLAWLDHVRSSLGWDPSQEWTAVPVIDAPQRWDEAIDRIRRAAIDVEEALFSPWIDVVTEETAAHEQTLAEHWPPE